MGMTDLHTRKLKRPAALLLAVLLLTGLCACGGTAKEEDTQAADAVRETAEPSPTPDDGEEVIVFDSAPPVEEDGEEPVPAEANIEETLLLDVENVKITATGIDYDGWAGPELQLTIENNTETAMAFMCDDVYINGCKVSNGLYTEVGAGKTEDEAMSIYTEELASYGIDTIAEVTMYFQVSATNSWETYYLSDAVTLRTDAGELDQLHPGGGRALYNANGVKIVNRGRSEEDTYWGPAILLYFENNTARTITFQTREGTVNGFPVEIILSTTLRSGMCAVDDMSIEEKGLAENGIEEIKTVTLKFALFDGETGEELMMTDEIKISF